MIRDGVISGILNYPNKWIVFYMDKRTREYKAMVKEQMAKEPLDPILLEPLKPLYKVTLKVNDTENTAEGDDLEQAILKLTPPIYKTLAYLTMEREGRKIEMRFGVYQCKRFFVHEATRKIKCAKFEHLFA